MVKCYRCSAWPCECGDGITLINGDAREVVPAIGVVADMVLADPPYGETQLGWDRWPRGWIAAIRPALESSASLWCFGSARMFWEQAAEFAGWRFVQDVVWEKHNGSGFLVDRFRRVHESAYHFVPDGVAWDSVYKSPQFTADATARTVRKKAKPAHWHGAIGTDLYKSIDGGPRFMRSVIRVRSMHGRARHPTEKPVGILSPLVDYACPPNGLLLVPFAGSGSELQAAKELGRRAIGVEIDPRFCEIAAKRLRQAVFSFQ